MNFLIGETNEKVRKERTKYIDESQQNELLEDESDQFDEIDNTDINWEDEEDANETD